jgi:hypothetical protein
MRIHELDENLGNALLKGASKLAPTLTKTAAPAVGQTYNFALKKSEIIDRITRALTQAQKTGQPVKPVDMKDLSYEILRNMNKDAGKMVNQLGYTQAEKLAYNSALQNWPKNNGAWAQKDFGPAKTVGQGMSQGGRTENYYATITKDRDNLDKFMKSFPDLDKRIQQLAQQTGQPISYKTNAGITGLANDNDNLKLFYYDPKLKPQIEATVKSWLQANGITTGARTHTHGVDVGGKSFGQSITDHVDDAFNKMFTQHGAKYTPEQYYQWLGTNFTKLIGQVSAK